jgi:hypothetical protein
MAKKAVTAKPFYKKTAEELAEDARKRARAKIFLKDPLVTKQTGLLNDYVVIGSDTSIREGPTSARFIVIDYDATTDTVEDPAVYREKIVDWNERKREALWEFEARPKTRQAAQINAWATAVDTLQFFQQEQVLGREVGWAFDGSRLRILPHAAYEANAFYCRQTMALHFGYFRAKEDSKDEIRTSLSHDVVAHETSHAILDGIRPNYLSSMDPDTLSFHEYIGDLGAMLSLFRNREGLAEMIRLGGNKKRFLDFISDLAPQVAEGLYGHADRSFLRSARNRKTYDDVKDRNEIHLRSQVLSGFAFDLLNAIYNTDVKNKWESLPLKGLTANQKTLELLARAARTVGCMLLTPLDYLPPDSVSFHEYAAIVLALDTRAYPDDYYKYRKQAERLMKKRGIYPAEKERNRLLPGYALRRFERYLIERDIDMIRRSRVGAYRFMDANRKLFRIPADKDFRIDGVATNQRETGILHKPPPLTFIQYVWDEYIPVPKTSGNSSVDELTVSLGGTLVIDDNVNIEFWVPPKRASRVRARGRERIHRLMADGRIDMNPSPGLRSGRMFLMEGTEGGRVRPLLNTVCMHADRMGKG